MLHQHYIYRHTSHLHLVEIESLYARLALSLGRQGREDFERIKAARVSLQTRNTSGKQDQRLRAEARGQVEHRTARMVHGRKPRSQLRAMFYLVVFLFVHLHLPLPTSSIASTRKPKRAPLPIPRLFDRNASICIVSLPHENNFLPLLTLAKQLISNGMRVTMVVPESHVEWVKSLENSNTNSVNFPELIVSESPRFSGDNKDLGQADGKTSAEPKSDADASMRKARQAQIGGHSGMELLRSSFVSRQDRQSPEMRSSWSEMVTHFELRELMHVLTRKHIYDTLLPTMEYFNMYHAPMLKKILAHYGESSSKEKPDLFVVDRYTFAGFSAASYLGVPYIVNSVGPLNDLDNPDNHVPAPLADHTLHGPQSIIGRCLNIIFRLRYRLTSRKAFLHINKVRNQFGIEPVSTRQQMYGDTLVMANTVFGIDDPRPLHPLIRIVGALEEHSAFSNDGQGDQQLSTTVVIHMSSITPIPTDTLRAILTGVKGGKDNILQKIKPGSTDDRSRVTVRCVMSHVSQILNRSLNHDSVYNAQTMFDSYCDEVIDLPTHLRNGDSAAKGVNIGDISVISGDATSVYRAVSRRQPLIMIPFLASQLDMALRIARIGCGIVVHPQLGVENESRRNSTEYNSDRLQTTSKQIANAVAHLAKGSDTRIPYERSIDWLHSVFKSEGGAQLASDYVEVVSNFNASVLVPYNEHLSWWQASALDACAIYIGILVLLWLVTKTCVGAVCILWNNLSQADIHKLE